VVWLWRLSARGCARVDAQGRCDGVAPKKSAHPPAFGDGRGRGSPFHRIKRPTFSLVNSRAEALGYKTRRSHGCFCRARPNGFFWDRIHVLSTQASILTHRGCASEGQPGIESGKSAENRREPFKGKNLAGTAAPCEVALSRRRKQVLAATLRIFISGRVDPCNCCSRETHSRPFPIPKSSGPLFWDVFGSTDFSRRNTPRWHVSPLRAKGNRCCG
jgi:hypothetical protein